MVQEIRKVEQMQDEIGEDAGRVLEALHKEIACLRLAQSGLNHDTAETIALLQVEIKEMHNLRCSKVGKDMAPADNVDIKSMGPNFKEEISRLQAMGDEDLTGDFSSINRKPRANQSNAVKPKATLTNVNRGRTIKVSSRH